MGKRIALTIAGEPVGKGRARAVPRIVWKDGEPEAVVSLVTPADTRKEEARIRDAFKRAHPKHKPFHGPVLLRFTAVFETPKSFNRQLQDAAKRGVLYATKKPDKDNIEKLIVDALNGVAFADDQQVMGGGIKRYGSPARIEFSLESLAVDDVPQTPGEKRSRKREAEAQQKLALRAEKPVSANPVKTEKPEADLSDFTARQQALIRAALAREERERLARGR